ncbi:amino acid adenylation domain-containing protein [Granulicoccus sp. GXG6511]|uniref:amino acid adenylation domain-containing protein n=1 Tax=Granulicoccus sp. GXG6511 TaxID=3381351 RepID=UPI003D7DC247
MTTTLQPSTATLPLTAAQITLWFVETFMPDTGHHTMGDYVDISGDLDLNEVLTALRLALEEVEAARGRYRIEGGRPVQDLGEPLAIPFEHVEFPAALSDTERVAAARADMEVRLDQRFDLTEPPLLRVVVYHIADDRILVLTLMHHLVCDGYSRNTIYDRWQEIHRLGPEGGRPLPPLATLVDAESAYRSSRHFETDKRFWTEQAPRLPEPCSLSVGNSAPDRVRLRSSVHLPAEVCAPLRAAVAELGLTWGSALIGAGLLYTAKFTGRADPMIAVPFTTRVSATERRTPGMVANYPPLTATVEQDATGSDFLRTVSRDLLRLTRHQRYRGEEIRRLAGYHRSDRRALGPFLNVLPQEAALDFGAGTGTLHNLAAGMVDDIVITLLDTPDGGQDVHVNGHPNLHSDADVAGHAARFADFVTRFLADLDRPVGALGLLPDKAPEHGPALTWSPADGVVEAVHRFARSTPGAVAVRDERGEVGYADLAAHADSLARALAPGEVVGVLAEPGRDFVTALVAALQAGGVWTPLDVDAPAERHRTLLADSGARTILAAPGLLDRARALAADTPHPVEVIEIPQATGTPLDALRAPTGGPDSVAYVLFTSGTTGRPKGAMVHRAGLLNHLRAKIELLDLGPDDTVIQNAPVTFDVSIWQMLAPLLVGGATRPVSKATAADPDALAGLVVSDRVTHLELVPSLLGAALQLWQARGERPLGALKTLMATGEALPPDMLRAWHELQPAIPLINAYGPTECSDDVTHAVLWADTPVDVRVPIGRAIPGATLQVLGPDLTPVPDGVVGELYVSGICVGPGYLGDPVKTATTFVARPDGAPGERMYRTGDRVLRNPAGDLEFVERRDHQVKIAGQRIELGEVEAGLRSLDGVAEAAALAVEVAGTKRLAGYVVTDDDPRLSAGEVAGRLRAALRDRVPANIIPTLWCRLDALPLTGHGKVDRKALPGADRLVPAAAGPVVPAAPSTAEPATAPVRPTPGRTAAAYPRHEHTARAAMAEVLGLAEVGPTDDFFALGGDSITVIALVTELRRGGWRLEPHHVFEAPTARRLAEAHAPVVTPAPATAEPATVATDGATVLPVTPVQRGILVQAGESHDPYVLQIVARLHRPLDPAAVQAAFDRVLELSPVLGARFRATADDWVAELGGPGVRVRLIDAPLDDVARAERSTPFDLTRGPLLRCALVPEPQTGSQGFVFTMHHVLVDGWSLDMLLDDLTELLAGREPGPRPQVGPGDLVLDPKRVEAGRRRWTGYLDGLTDGTFLSADPWADAGEQTVRSLSVPAGLQRSLGTAAAALRVTPGTLMTVAWGLALARATGRDDVLFGSVVSTREPRPEAQRMLGMFLNTLPTRVRRLPGETARSLLARIQRELVDRRTDAALPLGEILRGSPDLRALGEPYDTCLVIQNFPWNRLGDKLAVDRLAVHDTRHHPVSLVATPVDDGSWTFRLESDPLRVDDRVVAALGQGFLEILEGLCDGRLPAARAVPESFRQRDPEQVPRGGPEVPTAGPTVAVAPSVAELQALFGEVLGGSAVKADDDFFRLGGDSIAVARLAARVATRWEVSLSLRRILQLRTPAAIAEHLGAAADPVPATGPEIPARLGLTSGPMSSSQSSLWFLHQVDPDPARYHINVALELRGELDVDLLGLAVSDVVARHEVLRTTFHLVGREPVQRVAPVPAPGGVLHVISTTEPELDDAVRTAMEAPFDLAHEPPFRATLFKLSARRSVLQMTCHHIAFDGGSAAPLARELAEAYRARVAGVAGGGPAPVQYLDFVRWQADRLGDPSDPASLAGRQQRFWLGHLAGLEGWTSLPPDHEHETADELAGRQLLFRWDREVLTAAESLARAAGTTRFAVYQVALAAALQAMGAPSDQAFGTPVGGRPLECLEDAIGLYANTVVCRITLDPTEAFVDAVRRRGAGLALEMENADVPYDQVVRAINPHRAGGNELFQTVLVLQNQERPQVELPGLVAEDYPPPVTRTRSNLTVAVVEDGEGMTVAGEYVLHRYAEASITELIDRFRTILLAAAADPERVAADGRGVDEGVRGTGQPLESRPRHPVSEGVLAEVVAAYAQAVDRADVDPDVSYFDLGGHSIAAVTVAVALAGHRVDVATVMNGWSARELAAWIEQSAAPPADAAPAPSSFVNELAEPYLDVFVPLLPIRPEGSAAPLFCFHGGAGFALPYSGLAATIDPAVPLFGLQSPALVDDRVALSPDVPTLVADYLTRVRSVQPHGPYRLLGWSFGGWAAQEAARQLEAAGESVELLVLIDAIFPDEATIAAGLPGEESIADLVSTFARYLDVDEGGTRVPTTVAGLHAALVRQGGTMAWFSEAQVGRLVATMRGHMRLARHHTPGVVNAPTLLIHSASPGTDHPHELVQRWEPYFAGPLTSTTVETSHEYLMHPLPQRLIGSQVNALLDDAGRQVLEREPRLQTDPPPATPATPKGSSMAPAPETALDQPTAYAPAAAYADGHRLGITARARRPADVVTEVGVLVRRRLRHLAAAPARILWVVMNPLIMIVALGYLFADALRVPGYEGNYMQYLLAGVALQAGLGNIGPTGVAVRADVDKGIMDRFRSLPMGRSVVLVAHSIADTLIAAGGLVIVVIAGLLVGWRPDTDAVGFLAGFGLLLLFTHLMIWVGIALGMLIKSGEAIDSMGAAVMLGLSFFSNALFAPNSMPGWVQPIAEWNPVSGFGTALRELWGNPVAESASIAGDHPLVVVALTTVAILAFAPAIALRCYRRG